MNIVEKSLLKPVITKLYNYETGTLIKKKPRVCLRTRGQSVSLHYLMGG